MQIEIRIDSSCTEPKIIILTAAMTDEVNNVIKKLSDEAPQILAGFHGDTLEVLRQPEIIRIYASAGKICVTLTNGMVTYVSRRYVAKIKQALGI